MEGGTFFFQLLELGYAKFPHNTTFRRQMMFSLFTRVLFWFPQAFQVIISIWHLIWVSLGIPHQCSFWGMVLPCCGKKLRDILIQSHLMQFTVIHCYKNLMLILTIDICIVCYSSTAVLNSMIWRKKSEYFLVNIVTYCMVLPSLYAGLSIHY